MLSIPLGNTHPRVHCITNYVTAGDCANMLLACGASPIMADDPKESAAITAKCDALVINTGTLHEHTIPGMLASGKAANEKGIPVILDPVGVGSSDFRKTAVTELLKQVRFSVIRGNRSEIRTIAGIKSDFSGVDVGNEPMSEQELLHLGAKAARQVGSIVVISGSTDVITDGRSGYLIRNGSVRNTKITGAGCMLTALIGAYCAAEPHNILQSAASAVLMYGIAAELAELHTLQYGIGSFRAALFDAVELLQNPAHNIEIESRANYETIPSIPTVCHHRTDGSQ